jgi:hypothetical protein
MQGLDTWATALGVASGFGLMRYRESSLNLLVTSAVINAALAPLTAVVAKRRGRSAIVWGAVGIGFGMWALAAALVLIAPPKAAPPTSVPPPRAA